MTYTEPIRPDELYHHGIKGQRWGIRRFQNEDGSYTAAGRKHYGIGAAYKKATGMQNEYHSKMTKKYEAMYGKNSAQAKASRELDSKITKKRQIESEYDAGKTAVKRLLLNSTMAKTYDMARAAGMGRGESIARSILDINGSTITAAAIASAIAAPIGAGIGAASYAATGAAELTAGANAASRAVGIVAGAASADAITKKNYKSGSEWSLQQRAIRKKYVREHSKGKRR